MGDLWIAVKEIQNGLGAVGVVIILVWAVKKEELVTGSQYRQEKAGRERAEARAEKLEAVVADSTKLLQEQINVIDRTARVLEALARGKAQHD